jgi:hypothetical protein
MTGALVGQVFWGHAALLAYLLEAHEAALPLWIRDLDLPDTLGSICSLIAAPVAVGGWLLLWGDSGPPAQWLLSWPLNIAVTGCLYGVLGAVTGSGVSRARRRRKPQK